jgi:hypothetical protein
VPAAVRSRAAADAAARAAGSKTKQLRFSRTGGGTLAAALANAQVSSHQIPPLV